MRVEVVESPIENQSAETTFSDGATERALKNFFAAVASDDSLFATESPGTMISDGPSDRHTCAAVFAVRFRDEQQASSKALHFSLIEKLTELLQAAGSSESLAAMLCLLPAKVEQSKLSGFHLWMRLEATGTSSEQAGLRWGLGLAHVQQALLFLSRYLRQQISQNGD